MKFSTYKIVAILVSLVFIGVTIAALFVIESPATVRKLNADNQRINHLQSLTYAIDGYAAQNEHKLPESLDALVKTRDYGYIEQQTKDPETGASYTYTVKSETTYELCAEFDLPTQKESQGKTSYTPSYGPIWDHPAGKHCFTLEYKKQPNPLEVH